MSSNKRRRGVRETAGKEVLPLKKNDSPAPISAPAPTYGKNTLALAAACLMLFSGCSEGGAARSRAADSAPATVSQLLEAADAADSAGADSGTALGDLSDGGGEPSFAELTAGEDGVDIDLTKLNSTLRYAEVSNIMYTPDDYIGKIIRMSGQLAVYQPIDENGERVPDTLYYACIIPDATACCQQGIEFLWAGGHRAEEYPAEGTDITVTGEFELYEEDGFVFCRLKDASLSPGAPSAS